MTEEVKSGPWSVDSFQKHQCHFKPGCSGFSSCKHTQYGNEYRNVFLYCKVTWHPSAGCLLFTQALKRCCKQNSLNLRNFAYFLGNQYKCLISVIVLIGQSRTQTNKQSQFPLFLESVMLEDHRVQLPTHPHHAH